LSSLVPSRRSYAAAEATNAIAISRRLQQMDFAILPPEINSGRMYAGPGSGPLLAAAAAWDGLAAELRSATASDASVISGLTAGPWLGPASASMAAAASPYLAWMSTTAAQAEQAASQAKAAAAAYEGAFAATVPPPVIAANRSLLMALVATNIFGQNTPAIATTEAQYAEMWAQDATVMYGYAGASASATTLTPFTPPPQSVNPGGLGAKAAALAQAAGTSAATNTQTLLSQLTSAVPTALQGLASPLTSTSPAAGLGILQTLGLASPLSGLTGILQTLGITSPASLLEPTSVALASSELSTSIGAWNSAAQGDEEILTAGRDIVDGQAGMEARIMSRFDQLGAVGSAGSAVVGRAVSVGALSVPPGWTAGAPAFRLAAVALPATSLGAAPEVFADSPGSLFSQMALASMAGRMIGGSVSPGARERIGATARACPAPSPNSPGGPMTGIAAEINQLTEVLGKLGVLRDSGILTAGEFNEQKKRLLSTTPAYV
jgi:PPE-repeat protein